MWGVRAHRNSDKMEGTMARLIILAGAPGSGKSSVAEILNTRLSAPYVDFGKLREFHLDREWKNQSPEDEQIAFENLVFVVRNYFQHGYKNVIVDDLKDTRVEQLTQEFPESVVFTLIPTDETLKERITGRNLGFKNVDAAVKWNEQSRDRNLFSNEHRIDNSSESPDQTVEKILEAL